MNARSYNPELGRFISIDPLEGNSMMPQSMNPYAYGVNNPYFWPDPTGMSIFRDVSGAVSGAASDTIDFAGNTVNSGWDATAGARQYMAGAAQGFGDELMREYYLMKQAIKDTANWAIDRKDDIILAASSVGFAACIASVACGTIAAGIIIGGTALNVGSGIKNGVSADLVIDQALLMTPLLGKGMREFVKRYGKTNTFEYEYIKQIERAPDFTRPFLPGIQTVLLITDSTKTWGERR
jgi:hypothetical protein